MKKQNNFMSETPKSKKHSLSRGTFVRSSSANDTSDEFFSLSAAAAALQNAFIAPALALNAPTERVAAPSAQMLYAPKTEKERKRKKSLSFISTCTQHEVNFICALLKCFKRLIFNYALISLVLPRPPC